MKYKPNFKYPEITPQHYRFGGGQFSDAILNPNGDWRPYLPSPEEQNKWGIESSACYIEAQQHAISALLEEKYGIQNTDSSARFNALKSNGTQLGGDPLKGADSIRNDGLISEDVLPFSEDLLSWEDYHSYKGASQFICESLGKKFVRQWNLNYDIVFERSEPILVKYAKLREALKRSPVPMSVLAWYTNDKGEYYKPAEGDQHLTLCVYLDEENRPYFFDTYEPFLKTGEPFYNSDFAIRWSVSKKTKLDIISIIKNIWKKIWKKEATV